MTLDDALYSPGRRCAVTDLRTGVTRPGTVESVDVLAGMMVVKYDGGRSVRVGVGFVKMVDDPDYAEMTDRELADTLAGMYRHGDPDDPEAMILAENEVCGRAEIPLDETAQGMTPAAVRLVNAWISAAQTPPEAA